MHGVLWPASIAALQVQQQQQAASALRWKLVALARACQQRFGASIPLFQAWLAYASPLAATAVGGEAAATSPDFMCMVCQPGLSIVSDTEFAALHIDSCKSPLRMKDGLPARIWRSGAVQVVQSLSIIPPGLHPRNRLRDDQLSKVSAVMYIPVFDVSSRGRSPAAVLEVFLSAKSTEPSCCVADLISFVETSAASMALSVRSPLPQPICRSTLSGRRARVADSAEELPKAACAVPATASASPTQTKGTTHQPSTCDEEQQCTQATDHAAVREGVIATASAGARPAGSPTPAACAPLTSACTTPSDASTAVYAGASDSASDHLESRCRSVEEALHDDEEVHQDHCHKKRRLLRTLSLHAKLCDGVQGK